MLSSFKPASSSVHIGLKIGQTFPDIALKNSNKEENQLSKLIQQKTVIMVQPGASHEKQWEGRTEALEAWKAFMDPTQTSSCVAGCTGHLLGYIQQYFAYKAAGYDVIVIMSQKTAEELKILEKEKGAAFPLYVLTEEALQELKRLQHPAFTFEDQEYVYRNTWAVTKEMEITHCTNSVNHVADISKDEAAKFLGELKADPKVLKQ